MLFQPQEDENTNKNDMNETFVVSDNSEKSFEHLLDKDLSSNYFYNIFNYNSDNPKVFYQNFSKIGMTSFIDIP